MKTAPVFLTVEQVLEAHQRLVTEFGGDPLVRDYGLLESAVAMPQARFGGALLTKGIPGMAAAYLFHLCLNHPFMDGNKRTAIASAETFILANGMQLDATDQELEKLTIGIADGSMTKKQAISFFKKHVKTSDE